MATFSRILVPSDFGEPAERALDVAVALASKFDAKLTLLHASSPPPYTYAAYAEGISCPTNEMTKEDQKVLDAIVETVRARHHDVEGVVVMAEAWQAILEATKERAIDLIVMGTHGRRGLSRVFLGSVAEKVVRLSPVPVLTVSGKADREAKERALATL